MNAESSNFKRPEKAKSIEAAVDTTSFIEIVGSKELPKGSFVTSSTKEAKVLVFNDVYPGKDSTDKEVAKAIRELGNDEFEVREQAFRKLVAYGNKAIPLLSEALDDSDPQIRLDARRALKAICLADPESLKPTLSELSKRYKIAGDLLGWEDSPFSGTIESVPISLPPKLTPESRRKFESAIEFFDKGMPEVKGLDTLLAVMEENKKQGGIKGGESDAVIQGVQRLFDAPVALRIRYAEGLLNGEPTAEDKAQAIKLLTEALRINRTRGGTLGDLPQTKIALLVKTAKGFDDKELGQEIGLNGGTVADLRERAEQFAMNAAFGGPVAAGLGMMKKQQGPKPNNQ
ncbi:MAG: hypothetical protein C5B53_08565 [Candidatus Melainabacteria bacterium]|nr:MAG: hypothetical protein C5B53_08565 [Candidatus Melainabacteria bacterium]